MSEGAEEGEKSFEPTQRRLDEARKRGEVPQSQDLATAAAYGGFLLAATAFGAASLLALGAALATMLTQAAPLSDAAFAGSPQPLWGAALGAAGSALWPWLALPAAAALLCLLAQGSLVVAPERLSPKLDRLSPLAQARQRFGAEGIAEFVKGLLKVGLYGAVLGTTLARETPRLVGSAAEAPGVAVAGMLAALWALVVKVALVAAVLGVLDLVWQRFQFRRRHMMTRREVTDEMKDSEGDPHLKHARRSRAVDIAMNRQLADVPKASVVIVNPTHYAVALAWDAQAGGAPVLVAKGVDEMARMIRERAMLAGVPIRRDPPTARAIHATVEVGAQVLRPEWRAVAAAIRFADRVRARAKR